MRARPRCPIGRFLPIDLKERFEAKVQKDPGPAGCWRWTACVSGKFHYGTIHVNGKMIGAHRVSWALAGREEIPEGMVLRHTCNVKVCVNPEHLVLGTQADNMKDWHRTRGR